MQTQIISTFQQIVITADDRWLRVYDDPDTFEYFRVNPENQLRLTVRNAILEPDIKRSVFVAEFRHSEYGLKYDRVVYSILDLLGDLGGVQ